MSTPQRPAPVGDDAPTPSVAGPGSPTPGVPGPGPHGGAGAARARARGGAAAPPPARTPPPSAPAVAPHGGRAAAGTTTRYPDPAPATEATAAALGIDPAGLLLTNGGAEAIDLVAQVVTSASVEEPEFSLYRRALAARGVAMRTDGEVRFYSDPHNPTGRRVPAPAPPGRACRDVAFLPLATGSWDPGPVPEGSWVVGSFTKVLACPGLRLGWVSAAPDAVAELAARQPRWSVNGVALAVLPDLLRVAAFELPAWAAEVARLRGRLTDGLGDLGLEVVPDAAANYVCTEVPDPVALRARLAGEHGVVVRAWPPSWIRVAVGPEPAQDRLLAALAATAVQTGRATRQIRGPARPETSAGTPPGPTADRRAGVLMVLGTASDAGKSTVVAGICRLWARRGIRVAPFKAQNMALNSYVTSDGAEIGRAQAMQAMAAGVEPTADMNPVLLKPTADATAQVVLNGRPLGHLGAAEYHAAKRGFWPDVTAALDRLRATCEVVVAEGAGSPAEINLARHDITNLAVARHADAPVVVVGDVDRGGVFAALYGTWALLVPEDRRRIRGFVVNKFRGDPALLAPGLTDLERLTGVPTLGVLPLLDVALDAEDSLGVRDFGGGRLDVAVVRLPRMSNFTDLDPLRVEPDCRVRFVADAAAFGDPDLVVLPGSKATAADLAWLRASAIPVDGTRPTLGICAGYQMLGERIRDPDGVEAPDGPTEREAQDPGGLRGDASGLGLLPVTTVFTATKVTRRTEWGYEIRHGHPEARLGPGGGEAWLDTGSCRAGRVFGTSVHGFLEDDGRRRTFLAEVAALRGRPFTAGTESFAAAREAQHDRLADALAAHVDVAALESLLGAPDPPPVRAAL